MKGGSQEVAAIVANMKQPDFPDTFAQWLKTVRWYPRAFDFKYESIVSILDINVASLFTRSADRERLICSEFLRTRNGDNNTTNTTTTNANTCHFGFTLDDFEQAWSRKLKALQFAITLYLKEPAGLTTAKFFIEKGSAECRFNILDYLAPYWSELANGTHEFHATFGMNEDEPVVADDIFGIENSANSALPSAGEFFFKRNDELVFMRRDSAWMTRRKGAAYTLRSARLIKEPFASMSSLNATATDKNYINMLDLVLEYRERDATLIVANMSQVLDAYARLTSCPFELEHVNYTIEEQEEAATSSNTSLIMQLKPLVFLNDTDTGDPSAFHFDFLKGFDLTDSILWGGEANETADDDESTAAATAAAAAARAREARVLHETRCQHLHKALANKMRRVKNMHRYWHGLWQKVIGVVDYADPIQAVMRTWDLKFAVLPCQLRWSNNLMMVLPRPTRAAEQQGKCLRFMGATEGELFVVLATTPSDQNTWYTFQITTKGVIFYKVILPLSLSLAPFFVTIVFENEAKQSGVSKVNKYQ